jgi:hypothetical protein
MLAMPSSITVAAIALLSIDGIANKQSDGDHICVGAKDPGVAVGVSIVFVGDIASLCPPIEEPRSADPDPLSQGCVSTGDFEEALVASLGKDAGGLGCWKPADPSELGAS